MSDIKTIWITGAKGFIGGELVRRLQNLGTYRVVGTDTELSVTDADRLQALQSSSSLMLLSTLLAFLVAPQASATVLKPTKPTLLEL